MSIKTFVYLIVIFGLIGLFIYLAYLNQASLPLHFLFNKDITAPAWSVIFITFLIGFLTAAIWLFIRSSSWRFAKRKIEKGIQKGRGIEELYYRGLEAQAKEQHDRAWQYFQQVLRKDNKHLGALLRAGETLRAKKNYGEAIGYHLRAKTLAGDNPEIIDALAEDYFAAGNFKEANSLYQTLLTLAPEDSLSIYRKLRQLSIEQGNWTEASQWHQKILKLVSKEEEAAEINAGYGLRYQQGVQQMEKGELKEAESIFQKLIKSNKSFAPAYMKLGEVMVSRGDEEEGINTWLEGFQATGQLIFLNKIEDYYLSHDAPNKAIEAYRRAISTARDELVTRFMLGRLYYRLEMIDKALDEFLALEKAVSYSPTLQYFIAKCYQKRDEDKKAADIFKNIIKHCEPLNVIYRCTDCGTGHTFWQDRCSHCGRWSTIHVDLRGELTSEEIVDFVSSPVFTPPSEKKTKKGS